MATASPLPPRPRLPADALARLDEPRRHDAPARPETPQIEALESEARRLAALHRYGLLDGEWEGSPRGLEAATRLVSTLTGAPCAAVHIITETEQVRISATGVALDRRPREGTFCNTSMYAGSVTMLPDLTASQYAGHPHVNGELANVRYYAAVPLVADDGEPLGTVCAWSEDEGRSDAETQQALVDVGTLLADELEARRLAVAATRAANLDPLTQLPNRRAAHVRLCDALASVAVGDRPAGSLAVLLIDLIGFKTVNDTFGHAAGDGFLVEAARRLRAAVRGSDLVARWGGDEFLVIADIDGNPDGLERLVQRVHAELGRAQSRADRRVRGANAIALRGSVGAVTAQDGETPESLVHRADQAMYATRADR